MSKYRGQSHEGAAHSAPYPLSRLAPPHDLVSMAEEIQAADTVLGAAVGAELEAIARQIRALQEQAADVLSQAQRDAELHRVTCRLRKRPGQHYHLYRDAVGRLYFSLLSPEEWGGAPPHVFEGSYRLEPDMHWTPIAEIAGRDRDRRAAHRLLGG